MSNYDPVPKELLLPHDKVVRVIPDSLMGGGDCTPRSFSLQVLLEDSEAMERQLRWLRLCGREEGEGSVDGIFKFMLKTFEEEPGGTLGRHLDRVISAACLHPDREASFDIVSVAMRYMEGHGTKAPDLFEVRIGLGEMGMNALMNEEMNEERVLTGNLHPNLMM